MLFEMHTKFINSSKLPVILINLELICFTSFSNLLTDLIKSFYANAVGSIYQNKKVCLMKYTRSPSVVH